jgi:hypothetical protein
MADINAETILKAVGLQRQDSSGVANWSSAARGENTIGTSDWPGQRLSGHAQSTRSSRVLGLAWLRRVSAELPPRAACRSLPPALKAGAGADWTENGGGVG